MNEHHVRRIRSMEDRVIDLEVKVRDLIEQVDAMADVSGKRAEDEQDRGATDSDTADTAADAGGASLPEAQVREDRGEAEDAGGEE